MKNSKLIRRYRNDARFAKLVDSMREVTEKGILDAQSVRDAAKLATEMSPGVTMDNFLADPFGFGERS